MNKEEYEASLYLAHHGVKGQKWGVRRFQNKDGTLTSLGEKRAEKDADHSKSSKGKTALKVGLAVAGTALAAYGAYKLVQSSKVRSVVERGMDRLRSEPSLEEKIANLGPEIVRKPAKDAISNPVGPKSGAMSFYLRDKVPDSVTQNTNQTKSGAMPFYLRDEVSEPKKSSVGSLIKDAVNSKSDTKALGDKTEELVRESRALREKTEKKLRETEKFLNDDKDYNARIMEALRKMEEMGRTGKKSK